MPDALEQVTASTARWLVAAPGRAAIAAARAAIAAGADELELATQLRERGLDPARTAAAASAAHARRALAGRLATHGDERPRWAGRAVLDELVLTRDAEQQASHPVVATWRARRFGGDGAVLDLCAGAGVDAIALGAAAGAVVAVERDEARAVLARHNLVTAGVRGAVVVGDALRPPVRAAGRVHADPSRRGPRGRARRLADYRPPVAHLLEVLAEVAGAGVVVSPAVAWDDPDLPAGAELEFIQVGTELIEAILWVGELRGQGVRATATILPDGVSRRRTAGTVRLAVGPVGAWLVEVAPAAVRARIHAALGAEIDARRIARRRALLTTDTPPPTSPWWRAWRVEAVLPPRPRHLRAWLADREDLPLEVAAHGVDADPVALLRALGGPPRGPQGRRIHLVRLDEGARAIVCRADGGPEGRPAGERGGGAAR